MRKKLLFLWSLLSLAGFIIGLITTGSIADIFPGWAILSIPLIIHLLYIKIFSEE